MDLRTASRRTPLSAGQDHGEDMLAEVEEPPDSHGEGYFWARTQGFETSPARYTKQMPLNSRRESLLTRQLHSETEHAEDESHEHAPLRGLSMVSNWSNNSTTSTAELTSDDGRSVTSPATSPPLPPTHVRNGLPITDKPLTGEPRIVGLDNIANKDTANDKGMEKVLAKRRCISFACGNKETAQEPTPPPSAEPEKAASPPKRKCMIKFACPSRAASDTPVETKSAKRPVSPPPPQRHVTYPSKSEKAHRGSDSTVTHISPRNARKSPSSSTSHSVTTKATPPTIQRKLSNDSDDSGGEGTRFHEFANSDEEPDQWVQESTCHRNRLTVNDTLKKENVIRKLGQEVDDEVLEEDDEDDLDEDAAADLDEDEDEVDEDEDDENDEDDAVGGDDADDDIVSDAGFRTDDEEGFAASDDESGDSDYEWWTPAAGRSTAATSTDHLDHLASTTATHIRADRVESGSSISSAGSGHISPRSSRRHRRLRGHTVTQSMPIERPPTPDLPDSTDFVCGTLDEDRPSEQAYISHMKEVEAAKHKVMPQDIDPTFPTSDPEMDEEDDEDLDDQASESEVQVHGELEELHGPARRRRSPPSRRVSNARSPPPPARRKSPAPVRHRSPAPPPRHRSPAPRAKSPAPAPRRSICRSPPPAKRGNVRSPAPVRKLFGQSPKRARSPAPGATRMTSPPNTRRASPTAHTSALAMPAGGLGARPANLTRTASLPRAGGFQISRMARMLADEDEDADNDDGAPKKRGAIDIVKGLEKKRLRRKEKLHAKAMAKAAAKGEKAYKVKPGKGCERMREVGLELQRYKGKGEHILSV